MNQLYHPDHVLIIGVSTSRRNMARNIVSNMMTAGYQGRMHLLGTREGNLYGHPILTSMDEVPSGIDLAVILTPAHTVEGYLDACGQKGVRYAVIETGGFSEFAGDRRDLESSLLATAKRHGMRLVGPNCLGVISTEIGLNACFMVMDAYTPGKVALMAQSGGVGSVYLDALEAGNLGVHSFVSLGNKLDCNEADFLEHFATEEGAELACVYLEDVKEGRRFFEAARKHPTPVLVQKANVNPSGARIAATHTASVAVDDEVFSAMCRQAGIVRVRDQHTMINDAMAFSLPKVEGDRLAIVARSGGHAVIAADAAGASGFTLPELPASVLSTLAKGVRAQVIRPQNPVDLGDVFDFKVYIDVIREIVRSDEFDALAVVHVFVPGPEYDPSLELVEAVRQLMAETGKPIALCVMSKSSEVQRLKEATGFPIFSTPEDALRAVAINRSHHCRRERIARGEAPPTPAMDHDVIEAIIRSAGETDGHLSGVQALELAKAAGFPVADFAVLPDEEAFASHLASCRFPVVIKLLVDGFSHKTEAGLVALDVKTAHQAKDELAFMLASVREHHPEATIHGILVQEMIRGLRETLVGGRHDPTFGPLVVTGFGGIYTELLKDVTMRLAPVSTLDIDEMIAEVVTFKAFRSFRGLPAYDIEFIKESISRMSHLLVRHPEIREFELNPVKVFKAGRGGAAVDARGIIGPAS